ncbi:hypothetical protein B5F70_08635 [Collinsella sp. An268]|nr:hypothetical protein B5F70_08635 [Collinsella sp. An268]
MSVSHPKRVGGVFGPGGGGLPGRDGEGCARVHGKGGGERAPAGCGDGEDEGGIGGGRTRAGGCVGAGAYRRRYGGAGGRGRLGAGG